MPFLYHALGLFFHLRTPMYFLLRVALSSCSEGAAHLLPALLLSRPKSLSLLQLIRLSKCWRSTNVHSYSCFLPAEPEQCLQQAGNIYLGLWEMNQELCTTATPDWCVVWSFRNFVKASLSIMVTWTNYKEPWRNKATSRGSQANLLFRLQTHLRCLLITQNVACLTYWITAPQQV